MADAVVVGAGPNGLAAAIELARNGRSVHVIERAAEIGGGTRTAELTLPGFRHDVCSAVHPLAVGSPFLATLPLADHGLELLEPRGRRPRIRSTTAAPPRCTARSSETADGARPRRPRLPLAGRRRSRATGTRLAEFVLGPPGAALARRCSPRASRARRPAGRRRCAARALPHAGRARAASPAWRRTRCARCSAPGTTAFGLVLLALGHACGWPVAARRLGGDRRRDARPPRGARRHGRDGPRDQLARAICRRRARSCSTSRRASCWRSAATRCRPLPARARPLPLRARRLQGRLRALGPVPVERAPECRRAGTVHLGGTLEEIAASEATVARGGHPERPVRARRPAVARRPLARAGGPPHAVGLLPRPERLDRRHGRRDRAPDRALRAGLPRPACSRARRAGPAQLEADNPNYVGGDINGGAREPAAAARAARSLSANPYATPDPRLFLCSSSTPPGGGVHGMCGYHAARAALRGVLR